MKVNTDINQGSLDKLLTNYYLDFTDSLEAIKKGLYGPFDSKNIPLVDYDKLFRGQSKAKQRFGIHYTPVTIAQHALSLFDSFQTTRNPEFRNQFVNQAIWLRDNLAMTSSGFGVWLHRFPFPKYHLQPPWVSAMAQGQCISVLLRAHQILEEPSYLKAARNAFGAFLYDIKEGGVSTHDSQGDLWLEEFPTKPPSRVLNGFIFALWGVLDYHRATRDNRAWEIWVAGIETLRRNLNTYKGFFWSRYDLVYKENASYDYHNTHVLQLELLSKLTDNEEFAAVAHEWRQYLNGKKRVVRFGNRLLYGALRRMKLLRQPGIEGVSMTGLT